MEGVHRVDGVVRTDHYHDAAANRHELRVAHGNRPPVGKTQLERPKSIAQSPANLVRANHALFLVRARCLVNQPPRTATPGLPLPHRGRGLG